MTAAGGGGGAPPLGPVLLLLGGVLAVAAALLGRQGFTGRDSVVGIDLGTTYSVVAISQRNNVSVIPDARGHVLVPSMVAFLPDGELLVGRAAKAHRIRDPRHTIFNAKRFIGQSYEDVVAAETAAPYEFQIASRNDNRSDDVCFLVDMPGHKQCQTPISVGGAIVRHLKTMAQHFVGHDQITKAVIAVPVDFNARQRDATVAAFRDAGLHVSRVLEEPTAAAIAYGLHQDPAVNFILVFDFGGGTLDVSLLFVRAGSIRVIDTLGDNNLGGEDIDAAIASFLEREFALKIGVDEIPAVAADVVQEDDAEEPIAVPPCTKSGIRRAAESLKRALSDGTIASASCVPVSHPDAELVTIQMTRWDLEALCHSLLDRTLTPVRRILQENHMEADEIDAVVLVGGSSRIPWIRTRLTEIFGGRPPLTDIDPDVAVAYGAARTLD